MRGALLRAGGAAASDAQRADATAYAYLLRYQQIRARLAAAAAGAACAEIDAMHRGAAPRGAVSLRDLGASRLYALDPAPRFPALVALLRDGAGAVEAAHLDDVVKHWLGARLGILVPAVRRAMAALAGAAPAPVALVRDGGAYAFGVVVREGRLFRTLFGFHPHALSVAQTTLVGPYADAVRGACDRSHDAAALAGALAVLRDAPALCRVSRAALDAAPDRAAFVAAVDELAGGVARRLDEVGRRLVGRLVAGFRPTAQDLDYPAALAASPIDRPFRIVLYPPVEAALTLLAQLAPAAVDDVARDAVSAAVSAVQAGAQRVGTPGAPDGPLFALRNLAVLRDQAAGAGQAAGRVAASAAQDALNDVCTAVLRALSPRAADVLRLAAPGDGAAILREAEAGVTAARRWAAAVPVYLHAAHAAELRAALGARLAFTAHRLAVAVGDPGFEAAFLDATRGWDSN